MLTAKWNYEFIIAQKSLKSICGLFIICIFHVLRNTSFCIKINLQFLLLKKAALFSCLKDKNRERGRNKAKFSIHCLTPQMAAAARAEPKAGAWSASRSPTWLAGALGAPAGSWLSQKPGQDGISDTPKWDRGIPIHTCWPARPIPHHHTWNDNCPETFSKD